MRKHSPANWNATASSSSSGTAGRKRPWRRATTPWPARPWPARTSTKSWSPPWKTKSGSAQEASGSLQRQLAAMQAKLAEAKRNLATLSIRKRAADFRKKMDAQAAGPASSVDDTAFAEVRSRMKAKVEQAEAEAAADGRAAGHAGRRQGRGRG